MGQIPGKDAREYFAENNEEQRYFWYIPKDWTRGIIFLPEFDLNFFPKLSMTELLKRILRGNLKGIKCPDPLYEAQQLNIKDGVLYAANTDEDAEKVMELLPHAKMVTRDKPDHDIHFSDKKLLYRSYQHNATNKKPRRLFSLAFAWGQAFDSSLMQTINDLSTRSQVFFQQFVYLII